MSDEQIQVLLARGVLVRVEPDREAARRELATAQQHLESAERISENDQTGALAMAYEAARKAIGSHLRSNGLRVVGSEGAHARTGEYGLAAFDDPSLVEHVRTFDGMRRLRNRSQYDALLVEEGDAAFALEHARAMVEAVASDLA